MGVKVGGGVLKVVVLSLKPGSHRKIVNDYRSKIGKGQEILSESGCNPLKIVLKLQLSKDF